MKNEGFEYLLSLNPLSQEHSMRSLYKFRFEILGVISLQKLRHLKHILKLSFAPVYPLRTIPSEQKVVNVENEN